MNWPVASSVRDVTHTEVLTHMIGFTKFPRGRISMNLRWWTKLGTNETWEIGTKGRNYSTETAIQVWTQTLINRKLILKFLGALKNSSGFFTFKLNIYTNDLQKHQGT